MLYWLKLVNKGEEGKEENKVHIVKNTYVVFNISYNFEPQAKSQL